MILHACELQIQIYYLKFQNVLLQGMTDEYSELGLAIMVVLANPVIYIT